MKASQETSSRELSEVRKKGDLSIYTGELSPNVVAEQMFKLTTIFPALEDEFINVLTERIVANEFTNERLIDAVSHLIDTFKYPRPSIADIIGFDCRIKLYSYSEYMNEILSHKAIHEDFCPHWIGDKPFHVKITDCERYNFKPKTKKKIKNENN